MTLYGDIDGVRSESGNLIPDDFPNDDLTKKLKAAYSKIQVALQRDKDHPLIDGTDVGYDMAVEIAERFAAAYSLKKLGPEFESKVTELEDEANADLETLIQNISSTTGGDEEADYIVRTPFYSWHKNPDVVPVPRGRLDSSLSVD